jgi:hypothetical protein
VAADISRVLQAGTEHDSIGVGNGLLLSAPYAWTLLLDTSHPQWAQPVSNFPINPGAFLYVSVYMQPDLNGDAYFNFQGALSTTVGPIPRGSLVVSGRSAEWIVERPQNQDLSLPDLGNYGTFAFTGASAIRANNELGPRGAWVYYNDAANIQITMQNNVTGNTLSSAAALTYDDIGVTWKAFH